MEQLSTGEFSRGGGTVCWGAFSGKLFSGQSSHLQLPETRTERIQLGYFSMLLLHKSNEKGASPNLI